MTAHDDWCRSVRGWGVDVDRASRSASSTRLRRAGFTKRFIGVTVVKCFTASVGAIRSRFSRYVRRSIWIVRLQSSACFDPGLIRKRHRRAAATPTPTLHIMFLRMADLMHRSIAYIQLQGNIWPLSNQSLPNRSDVIMPCVELWRNANSSHDTKRGSATASPLYSAKPVEKTPPWEELLHGVSAWGTGVFRPATCKA